MESELLHIEIENIFSEEVCEYMKVIERRRWYGMLRMRAPLPIVMKLKRKMLEEAEWNGLTDHKIHSVLRPYLKYVDSFWNMDCLYNMCRNRLEMKKKGEMKEHEFDS